MPGNNAYEAVWNRHEQTGRPNDIIFHIDGVSGISRVSYPHYFDCRLEVGTPIPDRLRVALGRRTVALISHRLQLLGEIPFGVPS